LLKLSVLDKKEQTMKSISAQFANCTSFRTVVNMLNYVWIQCVHELITENDILNEASHLLHNTRRCLNRTTDIANTFLMLMAAYMV